jgi:flagellar biosynthetic protein FliS
MSILGAHNLKLKLILYDSGIRFLKQAISDLQAGDLAAHDQNIEKTQNIIAELQSALDANSGDQTVRIMRQLYDLISDNLSEATHKHDPKILHATVDMLEELNQTWRQATY